MPRSACEVWDHFQVLNTLNGKKHVSCIYCSTDYKVGMANRMKIHILKCKKCPDAVKKLFEKPTNEVVVVREREPMTMTIANAETTLSTCYTNNIGMNNETPQNTIPIYNASTSTSNRTRDVIINEPPPPSFSSITPINIDAALARAIYATGVPLSLFESKYWKAALEEGNIHIPSRHAISTPLLEAEYNRVKENMTYKINDSHAVGLISDGWTNTNGKGVINFILTTPEPIYYKSVYPECQRETGEYLGGEILKVIQEVGSQKFVAVITDNASNMKSAWRIVTDKYPHISCVGCASHGINLLCNDLMKIPIFKNTLKKVCNIIKEIKNNRVNLATFEKIQLQVYGQIKCTLKLFCKTRWNSAVTTLLSYQTNKEALQTLAISHLLDRVTKADILSEELWLNIDEVLSILVPIADALKQLESNNAAMSDVPAVFSKLSTSVAQNMETVTICTAEEKIIISEAIAKRKTFCIKPIHLAANLLDPRYRGEHLESETPVATDFILKFGSLLFPDFYENYPKYMTNIVHFKNKTAYFGISGTIWAAVKNVPPNLWWRTFAEKEILAPIAIRLLSVPPSSASAERNWSIFGATHTVRRNRLKDDRLDKLIYIRSNLQYTEGQFADFENDDQHHNENFNVSGAESSASSDFNLSDGYLSQDDIDDLNNL